MKLLEKTIKSEGIYSGKIIKVKIDTVELQDGSISKREIVEHSGAVGVIAITDDNKIILVRQFRKAVDKALLEVPAGKLEIEEDSKECAKRELVEETGFFPKKLTLIANFYTSPGFSNEKLYLYLGENLEFVGECPDDGEFLNIEKYSLDEIESLLSEIEDSKTIIGLQYLLMRKM